MLLQWGVNLGDEILSSPLKWLDGPDRAVSGSVLMIGTINILDLVDSIRHVKIQVNWVSLYIFS